MNATLERVEDVAKNIKTFWFRPEKNLRHIAGQFVEITIDHPNPDARGTRHWFTLSSSPSTEPLVSITTKFATGRSSTFKQALSSLEAGDSVSISSPMGDFVLPKDAKKALLFIAGGIGVTPFHSMVQSLIDAKMTRTIRFFYGTQTAEEFIFKDLWDQPWIDATYQTSRLEAAAILQQVPNISDYLIYMSGPEQMVEILVKEFQTHGIPSHHLIGDYFPNYKDI